MIGVQSHFKWGPYIHIMGKIKDQSDSPQKVLQTIFPILTIYIFTKNEFFYFLSNNVFLTNMTKKPIYKGEVLPGASRILWKKGKIHLNLEFKKWYNILKIWTFWKGGGGYGVANIYPQFKRCNNCSFPKIAHLECTISL